MADRDYDEPLGPSTDADAERAFQEALRRMPGRPRGRRPACEGCSEADAVCLCDCCGQELCPECWGEGRGDLCGGCARSGWDEQPAEPVVVAAGLLR